MEDRTARVERREELREQQQPEVPAPDLFEQAPTMAGITMTQEQLQQLIQNAVALAIQGLPPAVPAPVQGTAATVTTTYAIESGGAGVDTWDFMTGDGLKLYLNGTKPLEVKFNGKQENLQHFIDAIADRAESFDWLQILKISDKAAPPTDLSLILQYGSLTLENVTAACNTYMGIDGRDRQRSACLRRLILSSCTPEFRAEIIQLRENYTVQVKNVAGGRESGALLLFILINHVSVETRTTVANIIRELNNMEALMVECKNDIQEYNKRVNTLTAALRARKITPPALIVGLFDG